MRARCIRSSVAVAAVSAFVLAPVRSQCATWDPKFTTPNGVEGAIHAVDVFDDGSGPALYVAGEFARLYDVDASNIARWDGTTWSALGTGLDGPVQDLAVFDDGTGAALYASGSFTHAGSTPVPHIARWDGSAWTSLGWGLDGDALALAVFDEGAGPRLFAAGWFTHAGSVPASYVARWDGSSWSSVGGGVGAGPNWSATALAVVDLGSGPVLYMGGHFTTVGGSAIYGIAKWDGVSWTPVGSGTTAWVYSIAAYDDGTGPALFAGGSFDSIGGIPASRIAKWNGAAWSALPYGVSSTTGSVDVRALSVFDAGAGPELFLGGIFDTAGNAPAGNIASWNGSSWSTVGSGVDSIIDDMAVFDPGGGPRLFAGGRFWHAGGIVARGIASTDGSSWTALGGQSGHGMDGQVLAFEVFDDGSGPALFAGGQFHFAGDAYSERLAKWDGTGWSPVPGIHYASESVLAMAAFDDGGGEDLYVGGIFGVPNVVSGNILRWDGSSWSSVGDESHASNRYYALETYDSGNGDRLYIAGDFGDLGPVWTPNVGAWTGTGFQNVGGGVDGRARALAVYDRGDGPKLIVAGNFIFAGSVWVNRIAAWNGSTWSPLGSGMNNAVTCLAVMDDGNGPALFAGGSFTTAGGVPAACVARWDGTSWTSLGSGVGGVVWSLAVFDEGDGPELFAGGLFTSAGGSPASCVARWNGTSWSTLPLGTDAVVHALAVYNDTPTGRPDLYLGGEFRHAGGVESLYIAEWRGCANSPGTPYCFGDGSSGPCPCGNTGNVGRGCMNSSADSALLSASGAAANDSVTLRVLGEKPTALTIFLQGGAVISPTNFGDGLRCVGGSLKRLYVKTAVGGIALAPAASDPSIRERSETLGDLILPGTYREYMTYYRDPSPAFCPSPPGSTFNSSNATRILW